MQAELSDLINTSPADKAKILRILLVSKATGSNNPDDNEKYVTLRKLFLQDQAISKILPDFVRQSLDLNQFWNFIKYKYKTYQERCDFIHAASKPFIENMDSKGGNTSENSFPESAGRCIPENTDIAPLKTIEIEKNTNDDKKTVVNIFNNNAANHGVQGNSNEKIKNDSDVKSTFLISLLKWIGGISGTVIAGLILFHFTGHSN